MSNMESEIQVTRDEPEYFLLIAMSPTGDQSACAIPQKDICDPDVDVLHNAEHLLRVAREKMAAQ